MTEPLCYNTKNSNNHPPIGNPPRANKRCPQEAQEPLLIAKARRQYRGAATHKVIGAGNLVGKIRNQFGLYGSSEKKRSRSDKFPTSGSESVLDMEAELGWLFRICTPVANLPWAAR